jgi:hypothetical protein
MKEVRTKSGLALSKLISTNGLRVDIILSEILNMVGSNDSLAIRLSLFGAVNTTMAKCGDKASQQSLEKLKNVAFSNLTCEDDSVRLAAAKSLSLVAGFGADAVVSDVMLDILGMNAATDSGTAGKLVGLAYVLNTAGKNGDEFREEAFEYILSVAREDSSSNYVALSK